MNTFNIVGKELWAMVRSGAAMLLKRRSSSQRSGLNPLSLSHSHSLRSPTIFLHGQMHDSSAWHGLSEELRDHSLGPLYAIDYKDLDDGLLTLQQTIEQIQAQYARWGIEGIQVNLVGHSLGGIVAAEFLRRNPSQVRRVITVGSRLKPTDAHFKWTHRSILPRLRSLQEWMTGCRHELPLHTIAAGRDWLVPREAALAAPPARRHIIEGTSHLSLLFSRETRRAIAEILNQG